MQNKRKILMAVGNDIAFDARVQRSIEALKDFFDITLICYSSNYKFDIPGCKIHRVKLPNFKDYKGIKKTFSLFWHFYFFLIVIKYAFKIRPDIFYGHDFFMTLPGWFISTFLKVFFIYDAHELIIPYRGFSQSLEIKFWYYLERLAIKKADLIICANEERAKLMQEHYKLKKIPNFIRNISPVIIKTDGLDKKLFKFLEDKKDDDFWVIYQGVIDLNRNLLPFIDAFKSISENIKLFFIGYGKDFDYLNKYIEDNNLTEKVKLLSKVPREFLHFIISKFNVGIVAYSNIGLNEIYCEPNKLYDYTQLGLPVICTCQHNLLKILEKYKIGEIIGCDENNNLSEEIKRAILKIKSDYKFYQENIKQFLVEYNWDNEKVRLLEIVVDQYSKKKGNNNGYR